MRKLYAVLSALLLTTMGYGQTLVFSDDFESGTGAWTLTGEWGLTTTQAYNGSNSLADSPAGLYNNMQTTYATLTNSFDLTTALDANVHMRVKYDIENGFDYCYIEMSPNNGSTWTVVHTFNGENLLTNWQNLSVSAGGFVGNSQVKLRFRFYTDAAYQADGIFIDSFRITSSAVDNAPPLIVHDPDPHYEGQTDTNFRYVDITDISGVASAVLTYSVDGGTQFNLTPSDTNGNTYTFAIPPQPAGAYVDYYITAIDGSPAQNAANTQVYQYTAGNYIKHDNAVVNTVANFSSAGFLTGVANKMTLQGLSQVTTAYIRNYTDINNPNDSIEFHIWTDDNGEPGNDIITPFNVFPEANLLDPQRMTRIDLRPLASQLDSLDGDIFIGFEVPQGSAWVCQTTGTNQRGFTLNNSGTWTASTTTYHFRVTTGNPAYAPVANFVYDNTNDPTVDFTDLSTNIPTSWLWDFDDGTTSTAQNPSHTFPQSGTYEVCLIATNGVGSSPQNCENVTIVNGPPIASFGWDTSNDPTIAFDETSQNNPTSWAWDFDDGNTSTIQDPTHTFNEAGTYEVCLVASNTYGSDTVCHNIPVNNQVPIPFFLYDIQANNIVSFDNETTVGVPSQTTYTWQFGTGDSSNAVNPTYVYPVTGGEFNVCLKAENTTGVGPIYCSTLELDDLTIGIESIDETGISIQPNPASSLVLIKSELPIDQFRFVNIEGRDMMVKGNSIQGSLQLDVSALAKGVYYAELKHSNGETHRLPIIVQ